MLKTFKEAGLTPNNFAVGDDRFIVLSQNGEKIILMCVDIPKNSTNYPEIVFSKVGRGNQDETIPFLTTARGEVFELDLTLRKRELCYEYSRTKEGDFEVKASHRCINKPVIERKVSESELNNTMEEIKNEIPDILKVENLSFLFKAKEERRKKQGTNK